MNLLWAAGYPVAAIALNSGVSASLLSLVRLAVAFLMLAPFLRHVKRWNLRLLAFGAFMGIGGMTIPVWLQSWGIHRTNPAIAALSISVEPLVTVVLAALILRQRMTRWQKAAFGLAIVGSWILTGAPRPGQPFPLIGDVALFVAIVGFALFNVYSPALFTRVGAGPGAAITFGFGAMGSLVMWELSGHPVPLSISPSIGFSLAYMAVGATGVAYYLWLYAVGRESLSTAALLLYAQPVLGAVISWALGQTHFTVTLVGGGLVVLAAMTIGQISRPNPRNTV